MQGSIAQVLGLAMHANAFLQGRDVAGFWPGATFFRFCRSVRFVAGGVEVAADPAAWLTRMGSGCRGVRMHEAGGDLSDVAFVGRVSRWLMAELGDGNALLWQPHWAHPPTETGSGRPWAVTYDGAPAGIEEPARNLEVGVAGRELESSLEAIARFAERKGSGHSESFRRALDCLGGEEPSLPSYHRDLAPPGFLSPQAWRLLAASEAAWVFGGMGAWNDEDHGAEGNRLTERLFDRLETALAAVVDSTLPPAPVSRP